MNNRISTCMNIHFANISTTDKLWSDIVHTNIITQCSPIIACNIIENYLKWQDDCLLVENCV